MTGHDLPRFEWVEREEPTLDELREHVADVVADPRSVIEPLCHWCELATEQGLWP